MNRWSMYDGNIHFLCHHFVAVWKELANGGYCFFTKNGSVLDRSFLEPPLQLAPPVPHISESSSLSREVPFLLLSPAQVTCHTGTWGRWHQSSPPRWLQGISNEHKPNQFLILTPRQAPLAASPTAIASPSCRNTEVMSTVPLLSSAQIQSVRKSCWLPDLQNTSTLSLRPPCPQTVLPSFGGGETQVSICGENCCFLFFLTFSSPSLFFSFPFCLSFPISSVLISVLSTSFVVKRLEFKSWLCHLLCILGQVTWLFGVSISTSKKWRE